MSKVNNESGFLRVFFILIIFLALLAFGYLLISKSSKSTKLIQNVASVNSNVLDIAPSIPKSQKTEVIIRNNDSSTSTVLVPNDQVQSYISSLPKGESLVSEFKPSK